MDAIAFASLPQLAVLNLKENVCISKGFTLEGLDTIRRRISKRCGSAEKQLTCSSFPLNFNRRLDFRSEIDRKNLSCCELESGSVINAFDYSFVPEPKYRTLNVLSIINQRDVKLLPILLHERFPGLKIYNIENTSIQKISKKNFEHLHELKELILIENQIEVIKSDTFEDLINVEKIRISMLRLLISLSF